MNKLELINKNMFVLLGITKQGHALTRNVTDGSTVLIKKRDYNVLLLDVTVEGAIVKYKDINMLRTLQF